jgi:hypothetical protein
MTPTDVEWPRDVTSGAVGESVVPSVRNTAQFRDAKLRYLRRVESGDIIESVYPGNFHLSLSSVNTLIFLGGSLVSNFSFASSLSLNW